METEQTGKPAWALEISAALAGRHFGLCGFESAEAERVSRVLRGTNSQTLPLEERLLGQFGGACDAIVVRLAGMSPEGLRAAAASRAPILVAGPSQNLLEGSGSVYSWPRDFMNEYWSDSELLIRLFRLLQSPASFQGVDAGEVRLAPLVLLADDDQELIALADTTLQSHGISCRKAEEGLSALRLARELLPDLMVLDVRMPRLDGFQVLEIIRRDHRLQMLRVILLTGCDDPIDIVRGSEMGANDYVGKPVSPSVLLSRIKRLLTTYVPGVRQWARLSAGDRGSRGRVAQWVAMGSAADGRELQ